MLLIGEFIDLFSLRGITNVRIFKIDKKDQTEIYCRTTKVFVTSCPSWLKFKPVTRFVVREGILTIWFGGLGK